jgi:hypothetical protein
VEWWVQVRQGSSQVQACSALRVVCMRSCSISRATDVEHRVSLGRSSVARLALPSHFDCFQARRWWMIWASTSPAGPSLVLLCRMPARDAHADIHCDLSAACPLVMRLQISAVTYLMHHGSPTIVLDCAADKEYGKVKRRDIGCA